MVDQQISKISGNFQEVVLYFLVMLLAVIFVFINITYNWSHIRACIKLIRKFCRLIFRKKTDTVSENSDASDIENADAIELNRIGDILITIHSEVGNTGATYIQVPNTESPTANERSFKETAL